MHRCLALAARGMSRVFPNPKVGAVIVKEDGGVLGDGWHESFGAPHAEVNAINHAVARSGTEALKRSTLYVNLEPCNHVGKTPPCTERILNVGIPRVVIGMLDPNPMAAGGAEYLRDAGVRVSVGILETECRRMNEGFMHGLKSQRPLVTLKIAQTLDGFVAPESGDSRWISCRQARVLGHRWRAEADGILIGAGTARLDDPSLTVRHVGGDHPRRFVLDRTGSLPPTLKLFTDAYRGHTTAIVHRSAEPAYEYALKESGGAILRTDVTGDGHLDLRSALTLLRQSRRPVHSLLVEAGPRLASALLRDDLVDRLFVFVAPMLFGSGTRTVSALGIASLDDAMKFADHTWERVGTDMLFRGYKREP